MLRARYGRRALQAILLTITVAVIADGFLGHPMAPMNLAGVIPWTYGRAAVIVALLTAGNFFCMACPFTLPRELGRRLGLATRSWPRGLRSKWLAVIFLVLFFWSYEVFDLWDSPRLTAWLLVGYFIAAFAVDTFFRGASFCKYVCPIGQFNFLSSLLSPLEVSVRSPQACTSCASHDCVRGNERQRGCELSTFPPAQSGEHGLHGLPGLRKGMPARQHRDSRIRSRTRSFDGSHSVLAGTLLTPSGHRGHRPRNCLFGIYERSCHGCTCGRVA